MKKTLTHLGSTCLGVVSQRLLSAPAKWLVSVALLLSVAAVAYAAPVETPGFLKFEYYQSGPDGQGTAVDLLTSDPNYPNSPGIVSYAAGADTRFVFPDDGHEQFGARLTGWFQPWADGAYHFLLRSDDASELWLGTDETTGSLAKIAEQTGCCNAFVEPGGGEAFTTQTPLNLQASKKYAFQILYKEGGGGDYAQVAIRRVGEPVGPAVPSVGPWFSSLAEPLGAVVNITTQPVAQSVAENGSVTFTVAATTDSGYLKYPSGPVAPFIQWYKNGAPIVGANGTSLTINPVKVATDNNAKIKALVAVPGLPKFSDEVNLTVTADSTLPTIASVKAVDSKHVQVTFSEYVDKATGETAGSYTIAGLTVGPAVQSASNPAVVTLTTTAMTDNTLYTLKVTGVKDTAGNTITAASSMDFRSLSSVTGLAIVRRYTGFGASQADQIRLRDMYRAGTLPAPYETSIYSALTTPGWENGSNYGAVCDGFILAPEAGAYTFHIASDDQSQLYLSTDDTPAGMPTDPTCGVTSWTNQNVWDKEPDNQASAAITLAQGSKYYFQVFQVEGGGGDGFAVGWERPSNAGTIEVVPGSALVARINSDNSTVTITQQPVDTTGVVGKSATFTVTATGSSDVGGTLTYAWKKNGTPVGGNSSTLTLANLATGDNNATITVDVTVPGKTVTSNPAKLTVVPDTQPPVVTGAAGIQGQTAAIDVGVSFDETLDATAAVDKSHYNITGGTINTVTYFEKSPGVVINVSGLNVANGYTVAITALPDPIGNKLTTNVDFKISGEKWGQVGAIPSEPNKGPVGVLAVSTNGFDMFSDGIGNWAAYDETTLVYDQATGPFDKKVRVVYNEPSSRWARAGLVARETSNFGEARAAQEGGTASRYQKVLVTPVGPVPGNPGNDNGNNDYETNRRLAAGGATSDAGNASGASPPYPNAWERIQRVKNFDGNDMITVFRSDDGVTWVRLGSTVWPNDDSPTPLAASMFVGPEWAPENGNIDDDKDSVWIAKFRDYGDTWGPAPAAPQRDYSIGVNFASDRDPAGNGASLLADTDVAGAAKQKFWNNGAGQNSTLAALAADKAGAKTATTASVNWSANGQWTSYYDGETNNVLAGADFRMMHGFLDTGDSTTSVVEFKDLPADLTGNGYDVYVYVQGGIGPRGGGYRVTDAAGKVLRDYVYARGAANAPYYTPVPEGTTIDNYGVGNYVLFKGLKEANIKIEATTAGAIGTKGLPRGVGAPRAPINGIQLVAPGSASSVTPTIGIGKDTDGKWKITYTGTLYSSDKPDGTLTPVTGATSPYTIPDGVNAIRFYRSK